MAKEMTDDKIREVLDHYETALLSLTGDTSLTLAPDDQTRLAQLQHALGMIPQMRVSLLQHRRDKVFRWLGFMQGILYCHGIYTIEEMSDHNRPRPGDIHGRWKEGDHCCYTFKGYNGVQQHFPATVVKLTAKRIAIKMRQDGFPRQRYVASSNLEPAHDSPRIETEDGGSDR